MNKQQGLSIVELMVALALSAILATAIYKIVQSNQQSLRVTADYAKTQDAARTALDILQYDLRMTGYLGCAIGSRTGSGQVVMPITVSLDKQSENYNSFIHGYVRNEESQPEALSIAAFGDYAGAHDDKFSALWADVDVDDQPLRPVAGSDVFISRRAIASDLQLRTEHLTSESLLEIAGPAAQKNELKKGQLMLISDCNHSDIFMITNVQDDDVYHSTDSVNGLKNKQAALGHSYQAGSQLMLLNTSLFFVAKSKVLPDVNSLYRYDSVSGKLHEMVPYIQNLKLEFNVDTDTSTSSEDYGAPDTWRTATQVENGQNISDIAYSVRVNLTVATEQSCTVSNHHNCLNEQEYQRVIYFRNSGRREQ